MSVSLSFWQMPPTQFCIDPQAVHLWRFPLSEGTPSQDLLNTEERQRAQRLLVPGKAQAFVVARTRLRQLLGCYLKIPPEQICFTYNKHGKPSLAGCAARQMTFNLSHSGEWGLCALVCGGDVGVDLEGVSLGLAFEPLAERFFSSAEKSWLHASSEARRRRNFYRLWTRKEAWLKGKGGGFSEANHELDTELVTGAAAAANGWSVMNFPVMRGYVGALAVTGKIDQIERWNWQA